MPNPIRILIVDDHAVVRKGLAMVLRLESDLEVVGEAENGQVGLALAKSLQPDIVLVDLVMPEMDGQEMTLLLRKSHPHIKVIMLTGTDVDDRVYDLVAAGIEGYVLKNIEPGELIRAIHLDQVAHVEPSAVGVFQALSPFLHLVQKGHRRVEELVVLAFDLHDIGLLGHSPERRVSLGVGQVDRIIGAKPGKHFPAARLVGK